MNNTFLVTGGAGFIGSHLVEALLERNNRVLVIDDLSTGRLQNIAHVMDDPKLEFVQGSVLDRNLMQRLVERATAIYHLAAVVGVELAVASAVRTAQINVAGTEVVLELAAERRKPVLITSTSEVYGKSQDIPFREDGDLVLGSTNRGRWSYACSKALDEFMALGYHHERKLPVVVVRLFNTVGPRQSDRYGMVLPRFVRQALHGQPITVYGSGRQTRCFAYVRDVVGAIVPLILKQDAYGQVFNIGSQDEISIGELAALVKRRVGSDSEISFTPYSSAYDERYEDMPRRVPDIERIRKMVGFEPRVGLEEIIDMIADEVRSSMRADKARA